MTNIQEMHTGGYIIPITAYESERVLKNLEKNPFIRWFNGLKPSERLVYQNYGAFILTDGTLDYGNFFHFMKHATAFASYRIVYPCDIVFDEKYDKIDII